MAKRSHRRSKGTHQIGKGRPPKWTRWKPGQSGNPSGRRKGAKNASTLALEELARKITVTLNGAKKKMTVMQVSYRRLADKAMAGDQKAFAFLLMLADKLKPSEDDFADSTAARERDLAIIADYLRRRGATQADPKEGPK
jgi:Family of unknown function (DUF5681)